MIKKDKFVHLFRSLITKNYFCRFTCILLFFDTVSPTGEVTYSEVIAFLKKQPNMITQYKSITTICNKTLALTGNHLVYARKGFASQFDMM